MSLTEFTIRAAKPREKPYKLADSGGLYLLVQPGGSRLWRMKYRVDGKEKPLAFGSYPQVSLAKNRWPWTDSPDFDDVVESEDSQNDI